MTQHHIPTSSPDALQPDLLGVAPPPFGLNGVPTLEEGPDPFDPERLRLSPDLSASLGVKKALLTIPVRKPAREWFFRVHPESRYQLPTAMIELKEAGELYLVSPELWEDLASESCLAPRMLFTAMNRQSVLFLWPIRLPGATGRMDSWSKSALEAAELARTTWVRVQPDQGLGAYAVSYAEHVPAVPDWPALPLGALLKIAFKERLIETYDHPVLRQLRGEV
jgi:hypothetical protein